MTAKEAGARPLVKICGVREEATLTGMNGLPVHYVGLMFAKKSRRLVTAEQAARLREAAGRSAMAGGAAPRTVGVFVNPTMEELADAVDAAKLDVVQLHGDETPDFCREVGSRFGVEVWRALSVDEEEAESATLKEDGGTVRGPERLDAYKGAVTAVLLDTAGGGTGRTFQWERIPGYLDRAHRLGLKLFVAGGLNPDNVDELLSRYEPDGVDISSGVETDGVKDIGKIAAFAERVKRG